MTEQELKKQFIIRKNDDDGKTVSKTETESSSSLLLWMIFGAVLAVAVAILLAHKVTDGGEPSAPPPHHDNTRLSASSAPEIQALVEWIERQGGFVHENITARDGPHGRGLFLDGGSIVKKDTVLYKIPHACYFYEQAVAEKSPLLSPLVTDETFQSIEHEQIQIAILLLAERNTPNSFWKPYLDTLSSSYIEYPAFWSSEQLQEFQSDLIIDHFQMVRKKTQRRSRAFHELVRLYPQLFGPFNRASDFAWADYTMQSRAFGVSTRNTDNNNSISGFTALVPFAAFLNHAFAHSNVRHVDMLDMFVGRTASASMLQGVELQFQYKDDRHPSAYFLFKYGMLPPSTETDSIMLKYGGRSWSVNSKGRIEADYPLDSTLLSELTPRVKAAIDKLPTSLEEDLQREDSGDLALQVRIRFKTILDKLEQWLQEGTSLRQNGETHIAGSSSSAFYVLNLNR